MLWYSNYMYTKKLPQNNYFYILKFKTLDMFD